MKNLSILFNSFFNLFFCQEEYDYLELNYRQHKTTKHWEVFRPAGMNPSPEDTDTYKGRRGKWEIDESRK
jgi:hypothetical protein